MSNDVIDVLIEYAATVSSFEENSIHGPAHWHRVHSSGMRICRETDADLMVVRFFAYLHDCCRLDDGTDPEHGRRAADNLSELPEDLNVLGSVQMDLLYYAIRHHADGDTSAEPTIGACWDSDRLDLGRAGILPSAEYMSTEPGREIASSGSACLYGT